MTPTVDNVMSTFHAASPDALANGAAWYEVAHNACRDLDPMRFHRAAGVIAALSPVNRWENNLAKAIEFYARGGDIVIHADGSNGIGTSANVRKAMRIYRGEDALDVFPAKSSPKVRSFFLSLVDPFADVDPVIDRHAFDIAVGMRTDDKTRSILSRKDVYRSFVNVYREAAGIAGLPPKHMQAITWVSWKEVHGI